MSDICDKPFQSGSIVVDRVRCEKLAQHTGWHFATDEAGKRVSWSEPPEPPKPEEKLWAALGCPACRRQQCNGHPAVQAMGINGEALNRIQEYADTIRTHHGQIAGMLDHLVRGEER